MPTPFDHLADINRLVHEPARTALSACDRADFVFLTPEGREGLDEHWKRLEAIRRSARAWRPARA